MVAKTLFKMKVIIPPWMKIVQSCKPVIQC